MRRLILAFLIAAWAVPTPARAPTWKSMGVKFVPLRASQCPPGLNRFSINHSIEMRWAAFCYG